MGSRLSALLVQDRVVGFRQMDAAVQRQQRVGGRIGTALLELGHVDEGILLYYMSKQRELPALDPAVLAEIDLDALDAFTEARARELMAVPLQLTDRRLLIGVCDPLPSAFVEAFEQQTGLHVDQALMLEVRFWQALRTFYGTAIPERYVALIEQFPVPMGTRDGALNTSGAHRAVASGSHRTVADNAARSAGSGAHDAATSGSHRAAPSGPVPAASEHADALVVAPVFDVDGPEIPGLAWSVHELNAFFQTSTSRDHVLLAALGFVGKFFARRALFVVGSQRVRGFALQMPGDPERPIEKVETPLAAGSSLSRLVGGDAYYFGGLDESGLGPLYEQLGLTPPVDICAVPVKVGPRAALLLVGDRGDVGVDSSVLPIVFLVVHRLASALERLILRQKQRRSSSASIDIDVASLVAAKRAAAARQVALVGGVEASSPPGKTEAPALAEPMAPEAVAVAPTADVAPRVDVAPTAASPEPPPQYSDDAPTPWPPVAARGAADALSSSDAMARLRDPVPPAAAAAAPTAAAPPVAPVDALAAEEPPRAATLVMAAIEAPPTDAAEPSPPVAFAAPPGPAAPPRTEGLATFIESGALSRYETDAHRAVVDAAAPQRMRHQIDTSSFREVPSIAPGVGVDPNQPPRVRFRRRADESGPMPAIDPSLGGPLAVDLDLALPGVLVGGVDMLPVTDDEAAAQAMVANAIDDQLIEWLAAPQVPLADASFVELLDRGPAAHAALLEHFPGPLWVDRHASTAVTTPKPLERHGPVIWLVALQLRSLAPHLHALTAASDADARYYAARLLAQAGDATAFVAMADRLFDRDDQVRDTALAFLERHAAASDRLGAALATCRRRLGARDAWVVEQAINAVARLKDADAIAPLIATLGHASDRVRQRASQALIRITLHDFGSDQRAWEKWAAKYGTAGRHEWLLDAMVHKEWKVRDNAARELRTMPSLVVNYHPHLDRRQLDAARRAVHRHLYRRDGGMP